ncbi:hypothetical protein K432DRAFT_402390 [Lepidopterella palustris CBS 459.81]|uniref:WIBG Mago-binding domain-containing protein n=1 Tax=Lepidopterella palustris CBS 459.81 TaxID=1314670 RepID=A0A8E2JHP7_9PEZI|nr:hypothetical protein K432DRAFT_402390 [Lepidopterella palustris CBS 459.81]
MPTVPTSQPSQASKSGITITETGERHIPASTRADGSVRKEIRVRPGYRPPEDVEVYKNRTAEAWKNRGSGGVPGAEVLSEQSKPNTTNNKNAKRREARKKAGAAGADGKSGEASGSGADKEQARGKESGKPVTIQEAPKPADAEAEKEKEAKKLTKKLRQARELKDKKEKGDALLPEQFDKVIKINELIRQLENLGFDANGEKKTET